MLPTTKGTQTGVHGAALWQLIGTAISNRMQVIPNPCPTLLAQTIGTRYRLAMTWRQGCIGGVYATLSADCTLTTALKSADCALAKVHSCSQLCVAGTHAPHSHRVWASTRPTITYTLHFIPAAPTRRPEQ